MINTKLMGNPLNWLIIGSMLFIGLMTYGVVRGNSPSKESPE